MVGASDRLRPILMTACAMTIGMVPMALALEKGSQMQAPLGRAVIGGLVMSTFATLLVVPSIFASVLGRRAFRSPSIHPLDPESSHFDSRGGEGEDDTDRHHEPGPDRARGSRDGEADRHPDPGVARPNGGPSRKGAHNPSPPHPRGGY